MNVEATGPNIYKDRIVEVGLLKVWPEGKREMWASLVNPQVPISPEVVAVHGIRNEDVAHAPLFSHLAQEILNFIEGCDLSGFNILRFDIPLLHEDFCAPAFTGRWAGYGSWTA
ncbi:MAG: 3'-5' exonuclease [Flavobacteriales bacterium]|nr:3'-5' exonuclease [Flavobacteriales bacterium]MDW8409889.1 3'-5' exonuclease [Flavobacteriales bacterium]